MPTKEEMLDAAHCASFMQRFKMAYWKQLSPDGDDLRLPEAELDKLAMLAWDELKPKE